MSLTFKFLFLFCMILAVSSYAEQYDADVTTSSGTYSVSVEVEDGEVTQVHWPNGGDMNVYGAEISDGEASGTNSRGESVDIAIDDYQNPGDGQEN